MTRYLLSIFQFQILDVGNESRVAYYYLLIFLQLKECLYSENGGTYEERCEDDYIDYHDGFVDPQKGSGLDMADMADIEPLDINPANAGGTTEDEEEEEEDDDHNFFDDRVSDQI